MSLSGHIGAARATALVDGRLSSEEEERAWSHVLGCPGCRELVEQEGWTKHQLGALLGAPVAAAEPPSALLGSLYAVDGAAAEAWATVDELERRSGRRRTVAVVGGGAVGAAVLGLITVTGPGLPRGETPARPSPATIRQDLPRAPAGSPVGTETNTAATWVRRSR